MTLPFPDLATHGRLYLVLAGVVLVLLVAQRVRFLRALLSLGFTVAVVGLLFVGLSERAPFDPQLDRIAGRLHLDDQQVAGREVRIRMAPDGHFWARVRIDGVERRMLIDSGATITALSPETAAAAGLHPKDSLVPVLLRTANGTVAARTAKVTELRLGTITARGLAVVVAPGFGNTDVLGMNFLSRLKSWRVEDGTLFLVPHHPVPA
jgi:aspartyl protease family protein